MKKTLSTLIASMGLSLTALAQDIPQDPKFWQTLSNKQRVLVDCGKLETKQKTVAFYAQYEPYSEDQLKTLTPQQQAWFKLSRQSRSTDTRLIDNLATHLETSHGIKKSEVEAAYQVCLTR